MDFNAITASVTQYFAGLTSFQKYAWIAIMLGLILVIIALILW